MNHPVPTTGAGLKAAIDVALEAGHEATAQRLLERLWRAEPNLACASFVVSRYERLPGLSLTPCRLAILRSFTVEPAVPLLRAMGYVQRLAVQPYLSDFNTYAQEILDPGSGLYQFRPDVVVLAVQARDLAPALWQGFAAQSAVPAAMVDEIVGGYEQWVAAFRQRTQAQLVIHTWQTPAWPGEGLYDAQVEGGQVATFQRINQELGRLARRHQNVYLLDYDRLVARRGLDQWHDERKWLAARLPIAARELPHLAAEWLRFLHPLCGRICKAVVVDLDNTLWGGVVGEDGYDGIRLDDEFPGAAFRAVQSTLRDLAARGILLAVCSKNNPEDALPVLREHPGMLLRPDDFAALRINWENKADNLRAIAAELNLGLDALAFVDDNPVERELVREQLPEVTVLELPPDPLGYARTLRECPHFERLSLSAEDRVRGRYYTQDRQRQELQHQAHSLEDFYRSLQMQVAVEPVRAATLPRAAQLTQKTNQFNLTTKRYHEEQLAQLLAQGGWSGYVLRAQDRFGDHGIVGVAILAERAEDCEIDTFLLSCRVIGRTVETAFLAALAAAQQRRGAARLLGRYLPTRKNTPCQDFYPRHGFTPAASSEPGTCWVFDLQTGTIPCPEWIHYEGQDLRNPTALEAEARCRRAA